MYAVVAIVLLVAVAVGSFALAGGFARGKEGPVPSPDDRTDCWAVTTDLNWSRRSKEDRADYWRPCDFAEAGGKCSQTACRTGPSGRAPCPPNMIRVDCSGPASAVCADANRQAGCVPCPPGTLWDGNDGCRRVPDASPAPRPAVFEGDGVGFVPK